MDKIQKKVAELHKLLSAELESNREGFPGVLAVAFANIVKELEALEEAILQVENDERSLVTREINLEIQAQWDDPDVQVDPYAPRAKKKAPAKAEATDEALD